MSFEYFILSMNLLVQRTPQSIKMNKQQKALSLSIIIERNAHLLVLYVFSHNTTSPFRICVPYVFFW